MSNQSNEPAAPAGGAHPLPDQTSPIAPYTDPARPLTPQYDAGAGAPIPADGPTQQAAAPASGLRVRDRVWSLRTVVAVAISAVALSGAGGAALAAASGDGSTGPGGGVGGQMTGQSPGQPGHPGRQFGPPPATGQVPGQLPPATTGDDGRDT